MKISRSTRLQAIAIVFPLLVFSPLSLPHIPVSFSLSLSIPSLLLTCSLCHASPSFSLSLYILYINSLPDVSVSLQDCSVRHQPPERPSSRFLSSSPSIYREKEKERKERGRATFARGKRFLEIARSRSDKFSTPIIDTRWLSSLIHRARIINLNVTTADKLLVDWKK